MARISVPLWGVALSRPLAVVALVGLYPTNKLIATRPLPYRAVTRFTLAGSCGITPSFDELSHNKGYVPCLYSPVRHSRANFLAKICLGVRLACIRHAASVHPEPGSNSQKNNVSYHHSIVKERVTTKKPAIAGFRWKPCIYDG